MSWKHGMPSGPYLGTFASNWTHTSSCVLKIGVCRLGAYSASCRSARKIRRFGCDLESVEQQSLVKIINANHYFNSSVRRPHTIEWCRSGLYPVEQSQFGLARHVWTHLESHDRPLWKNNSAVCLSWTRVQSDCMLISGFTSERGKGLHEMSIEAIYFYGVTKCPHIRKVWRLRE